MTFGKTAIVAAARIASTKMEKARGLPGLKANPKNLSARLVCLVGSWLSIAPLATGVPMGASHGIGYVLGALFGIPYGHTSCIMLLAVMRWNKSANTVQQELVSSAMNRALGMPRSLGAVGGAAPGSAVMKKRQRSTLRQSSFRGARG
jgi:alcohol dehydrogenase class IV